MDRLDATRGRSPVPAPPRVSPRSSTRQGFRPDRHTRGGATQGFALGYGPPGLQPGRVRPIRARGPGWGGVCNTPLPWYVHSGPFGYPASFPAPAGAVRRRLDASETFSGVF